MVPGTVARSRGELAEQALDDDGRQHRIAGPEERRLARGTDLHRAVDAERRGQQRLDPRAERGGGQLPAGGRVDEEVAVVGDADPGARSRGHDQLGRSDEFVGQDGRDPDAATADVDIAPGPSPRSVAEVAPRIPSPSASAATRARSAGGTNAAKLSGSTAAASMGIRYVGGGSSTTSPAALHERRSHTSSSATTVVSPILSRLPTASAKPAGSPRGTQTRKVERGVGPRNGDREPPLVRPARASLRCLEHERQCGAEDESATRNRADESPAARS